MDKKLTLSNRINITLGLLAVFLLVLGTNRVDQLHFDTVQNALTTVYKDRVLAQGYIFKMNNIVHEKKILHSGNDRTVNTSLKNEEFERLISLFAETELTTAESRTFKSLRAHFDTYKENERKIRTLTAIDDYDNVRVRLKNSLDELNQDLYTLAEIQLTETRKTTGLAQKSLDNNSMLASLEIWFLLIIGIVIQFVIFYRVSKPKKETTA